MVGTAGLPHVLVRFFTVPKVRDARMSAGWALLFIAILYTTAPAVGALARLNLTETIQPGPVFEADANLAYEDRPEWFRTWEDTGLLQFEDKNGMAGFSTTTTPIPSLPPPRGLPAGKAMN